MGLQLLVPLASVHLRCRWAIGGTVSEAQCGLADQKSWAFVGPPKVGPRQDQELPWWAHETQQECQI